MATAFQKDQIVKLTAVVPQGPVQALRMLEDGTIQYLVSWADADGQEHSRWFDEGQLTAA
jgi:hypothetical protein